MTWLLPLLGLGSIGGIAAALIFLPGLKEAAFLFLRGLPGWAWGVIAGLLLIGGLAWWHVHAVGAAFDRGEAAGIAATDVKWSTAFDTMRGASEQWRTNYEGASAALSTELEKQHDENVRAIGADADDLRLRGPGTLAACGRSRANPGLSPAPGATGQPGAQPDAPSAPLPDDEPMAVVSWRWLVTRTEEHDKLRDEVMTWRAWYPQQKALHDDGVAKLKAALPDPAFGRQPSASAAPSPD